MNTDGFLSNEKCALYSNLPGAIPTHPHILLPLIVRAFALNSGQYLVLIFYFAQIASSTLLGICEKLNQVKTI